MTADPIVAMSASEAIGTLTCVLGMFFIYHGIWGRRR